MAKFNQKLAAVIVELVENDMSVTEICKTVGINRKTFYEWKNSKPEFAQAIEDARERAYDEIIALARRTLRDRIEGYTVEETTFTYEPSPLDDEQMILKKKVVKRKRKEASIASLNNIIERSRIQKAQKLHNFSSTEKQKNATITPSTSQEAFILAKFLQRLEQESTNKSA
ncbi:phBC6A51 family helix-turn-helix protein [Dysgonomonas massiliensis]|uniref:phBC6A51 family helix-turn-helix protein n=1 Tax=Dysgonomonas massiliensis TaxID=2040292 RepID=UPI000C76856C|nr:phBC6A51 family helix-turn-helix protein [Dysgonomonas massiliensis]